MATARVLVFTSFAIYVTRALFHKATRRRTRPRSHQPAPLGPPLWAVVFHGLPLSYGVICYYFQAARHKAFRGLPEGQVA